MKVLAVGAAGANVGLVVTELVKRGIEVRGLVHDPAKTDTANATARPRRWRPTCTTSKR